MDLPSDRVVLQFRQRWCHELGRRCGPVRGYQRDGFLQAQGGDLLLGQAQGVQQLVGQSARECVRTVFH